MIGPEWIRQPALALWMLGWVITGMALVLLVVMLLVAWAITSEDPSEAALARDVGLAISCLGVLLGAALLLPSELLARNWPQVYTLALGGVGSGFAFVSLGFATLFSGS